MKKAELNKMAKSRVKGMIKLRDCVHGLIALQMDEYTPDSAIKAKLNKTLSNIGKLNVQLE